MPTKHKKRGTKPNKGDTHSAAFEHESRKMETTCEFENKGVQMKVPQ